jgi:hypothetical protein
MFFHRTLTYGHGRFNKILALLWKRNPNNSALRLYLTSGLFIWRGLFGVLGQAHLVVHRHHFHAQNPDLMFRA